MRDRLRTIAAEALRRFKELPPAEQQRQRTEQRISFAVGNLRCDRPDMTDADAERLANYLRAEIEAGRL